MSERLSEAQRQFLANYMELLREVESAVQYVSECYIQDDIDIGDRLIKSVMTGLISYNEENMTMLSVFGGDDVAMQALSNFQESVKASITIEETCTDVKERMQFIHEKIVPQMQKWKQFVERNVVEREQKDQ
ncbi:hypothetical protein [Evansella halocellulosilytica]|uniref:hypothetical protein n=1 Tax=Evansella halocellulosilytica TaxID=2011013 RepID=UPI000BB71BAB|nr:hypothetical protein [Evansella halocellulosilytica]